MDRYLDILKLYNTVLSKYIFHLWVTSDDDRWKIVLMNNGTPRGGPVVT